LVRPGILEIRCEAAQIIEQDFMSRNAVRQFMTQPPNVAMAWA
jgi:hypothetical protein